ncbi:MAG: tetratricopeptide repeat protein [Clostridiales bacterium]|nr:tetratricopeptide repeat protein [Clostridiales bacterium]
MSYKYSKFVIIISMVLMTIFLSACSSDSAWQKNMNMGERYLQDENYQDAISAFSKAIEINDEKPEAYIERGNVYAILEGNENKLLAISDYEKALTIDESLVNIYKKLYDIYIEEGLNEQAKNILQIGTEKTCD